MFWTQPSKSRFPLRAVGAGAALVATLVASRCARLSGWELASLFLSLEGTVLLASSISFGIPSIGDGLKARIRFIAVEFPALASPAFFYPICFYLGLALLFLGSLLGAIAG
jgi:hypothetical protein